MCLCERVQSRQKHRRGRDHAHISGDRLDDDRGDVVRIFFKELCDGIEIVERRDKCVGDCRGGHAGRIGQTQRGDARSGLDEQQIGVTVIASFKFDNLVAPSEGTCEAQCSHRRFGAGIDKAHHLDVRHKLLDQFREFYFERTGCAETCAARCGIGNCGDHARMRVTQDERAPRENVINEPIAIHVEQVCARAALDEQRLSADRAKRAHRRIHAAGEELLRAGEELLGVSCIHFKISN